MTLPPNPNPAKRRKPSVASISTHPLRQTSFPPDDDRNGQAQAVYSPGSGADDDLDIDDEIASAVGSTMGTNSTKGNRTKGPSKKRGKMGRPPKSTTTGGGRGDSASLIDGDASTVISDGRGGGTQSSRRGATAAADDAEDEAPSDEDDDADGGTNVLESGKLTKQTLEKAKQERAKFIEVVSKQNTEHYDRYERWNRFNLKKDIVRKLTNQTLSQSVPGSVVTTISAYTKVFAGEIVDRARSVQREWVAAAELLPNGDRNVLGQAEGEASVNERDLGPLLPDHLREALRRYRNEREGGTVGFTGLSLEGRETAAVRSGGRRLFR